MLKGVVHTIRYIDKTRQEAALLEPQIAILPLGSFEQHGTHLPLGTDIFLVEALAEGVASELGAFLLPAQPISTCYEHHGKIGSVHFSADIFYRFIVSFIENLHRKGFNKVAILQGHGGIFVLEPAVRYLNSTHPSLNVIVAGYEVSALLDSPFEPGGIHADDMETSLMLYLHPQLVHMANAVDFIPDKPRPYLNYGSIFTHSPSGVWGNATKATPDKGRWMLDNAVGAVATKIEALFAEFEGTDYAGRQLDRRLEKMDSQLIDQPSAESPRHFGLSNSYRNEPASVYSEPSTCRNKPAPYRNEHDPVMGIDYDMVAGAMTVDQLAERNYHTAYIPIASFAQHGPHLPLTTDILISQALSGAICARINAFMLPVLPYGTCMEQEDKYSVGVDPGLLYDMVLDIARELKRQGFRRLVLHQGCGGLAMLYPLTRALNAASDAIKTVLVDPSGLIAERGGGILQGEGNYHACELQTSLMLYLHGECVKMDKINGIDFIPDVPLSFLNYKSITAYCPKGVWGHPSLASAEKGKALFDKAVELSVKYIDDAFSFMDEIGDYTGGREQKIIY